MRLDNSSRFAVQRWMDWGGILNGIQMSLTLGGLTQFLVLGSWNCLNPCHSDRLPLNSKSKSNSMSKVSLSNRALTLGALDIIHHSLPLQASAAKQQKVNGQTQCDNPNAKE